MKRCPECGRTFSDETLRFCLYDGKPLFGDAPPGPTAQVYAAPPPAPDTAPPPSSAAPPLGYAPSQYTPPGYAPPSYAPPDYAPPYGVPPQKKSGWRWIGGIAVLLLFLRVVSHLANPAKPGTPVPSGTPAPAGSPVPESGPSDSGVHDSLVSAIHQADTAETQAISQGDSTPLYTAYTGLALQKQLQSLQQIKDSGFRAEVHLLSQEFGTFTVNADRSEAQVDVTETWSMTFYSSTNHQPLRSSLSNVFVQTLLLKRGDKGWTIDDARDKPH